MSAIDRADLSGNLGCSAEEPNDSLPDGGRDAGDLWDAQRREGISPPGGCVQKDLRRDHLFWTDKTSGTAQVVQRSVSTFCGKPRSGVIVTRNSEGSGKNSRTCSQ